MKYIFPLLMFLFVAVANGQDPDNELELDSLILPLDSTLTETSSQEKDRGKHYERDEKRLLKYLDEKKYKSLIHRWCSSLYVPLGCLYRQSNCLNCIGLICWVVLCYRYRF